MTSFGPSPFSWIDADENGGLRDPTAIGSISDMVSDKSISDLVVMSHGWKNDKADAWTLYSTLWSHVYPQLERLDPAKIAVAGVLWPSKEYRTEFDADTPQIAGGGALGAGRRRKVRDLTDQELDKMLADVRELFGEDATDVVAAAKAVAGKYDEPHAERLVQSVQSMLDKRPSRDLEVEQNRRILRRKPSRPAKAMLDSLQAPPQMPPRTAQALTTSSPSLSDMINGAKGAVGRLLNQVTYFEMKRRAGVVGQAIGGEHLPRLSLAYPLRLHLIGHSFGGRLVTAIASSLVSITNLDFFSLTLLQGAFSHNALSSTGVDGTPGVFATVIGKPEGPIAITHTHNDLACTLAYAMASRVSNDVTTGIGDANDVYGAMGANGAQRLSRDELAAEDESQVFKPKPRLVNNILADKFIVKTESSDAHNNVANQQCGKLVARVIEAA